MRAEGTTLCCGEEAEEKRGKQKKIGEWHKDEGYVSKEEMNQMS